jgi:arabinan endo-1,5-alpha-L-arabinosidase
MCARSKLLLLLTALLALPASSPAQLPVLGNTGAHDPSTLIKDGNRYYLFYTSQGLESKYSTDLRTWTYSGNSQRIFPGSPPAWTTNAVPDFTGFFWAPDVAYFNGKYHVYYSISSWGTIDSAIGLVTSPSLISPTWTDQGKVVQSDAAWEAVPETDTTSFNCIDPAILQATNGTIWMVYGSYSDGILVTQLDPSTGKRLNPASIGTKIASSSTSFFSNTTEAAHLHERGGYYYLFLNYGGCCAGVDSTYNLRVGRSTSVTGPYLDRNGINLLNAGGTILLESTGRFIGPGHPGILVENGTNWFTYHYYDANNNGAPTIGLNQLFWTADGWPALTNDWSAFYTFDTDAREHRAVYNGTLRNGASITNEPGRGRVLQLDGVTNQVSLPNAVANASTFAAWVKWNGGTDWQRLFDFGSNPTKYLFLTPRANSGVMRFAIRNGGAEQVINAPAALPTNSWVHVAVTLDGQRGVLYQNGLPFATNATLNIRPWQLLARSNYLGASQFSADPNFDGRIDSFRIFGRALSAPEIKDLAWAHPALAHRYSFTSNAWDSIGMAHGTLKGNATITNNALTLTGAPGGYVDLPGGLVSGSSAVSLEFWASFGVSGDWSRVFDFGNISGANGQNFLFFSPHTSLGGLRFGLTTAGGTVNFDPAGTFNNKTLHVVCLADPANNYLAIYTNGVWHASLTGALPPLSGVSTAWSFLGRSLFSADAWLNATIGEFRIYDGRLTPEEIAVNYQFGPDALALPVSLAPSNSPTHITLSWPAWAVGFNAEATSDLAAETWTSVTPVPNLATDRWSVSVPKTNVAKMFRLKR